MRCAGAAEPDTRAHAARQLRAAFGGNRRVLLRARLFQHRMITAKQHRAHISTHITTEQRAHHTIHLPVARQRIQFSVERPPLHRDARHAATGQRHAKVDAIEDRAGVDPAIARLRPAIRRLMQIDALAKPRHDRRGTRGRIHARVHRSQCTHHHFERRLHLRAPRRGREKLFAGHDRAHHFAQIAIGAPECRCGALHQRDRRCVADETLGEFGRDEGGGGRMCSQQVEQPFTFRDALARRELLTEHGLRAGVMQNRIEAERGRFIRTFHRPAGEYTRGLCHILLTVSTVDAQRVQLHQLAGVVLVQATATLLQPRRHGVALRRIHSSQLRRTLRIPTLRGARDPLWHQRRTRAVSRTLPVVQVVQHRRTVGHCTQQCTELAQHIRPDGITFVRHQVVAHRRALTGEHIEVIEPEVRQHFVQLPLTSHRARNPR